MKTSYGRALLVSDFRLVFHVHFVLLVRFIFLYVLRLSVD